MSFFFSENLGEGKIWEKFYMIELFLPSIRGFKMKDKI